MHVLKTHLPYKGARVKFGRRYARIYKAGRTPKDTPQEEEEYTKGL